MEEEKLRAVYYARCSTEEENQKDALVRQAAEAEEAIRARGWRLVDAYVESRSGTSRKADGNITACTRISSRTGLMSS